MILVLREFIPLITLIWPLLLPLGLSGFIVLLLYVHGFMA